MIYSPGASPEVSKSCIHKVLTGLIFFHIGKVSEVWHKTMETILIFSISEQLFRSI